MHVKRYLHHLMDRSGVLESLLGLDSPVERGSS
jgi:hypothetical protein